MAKKLLPDPAEASPALRAIVLREIAKRERTKRIARAREEGDVETLEEFEVASWEWLPHQEPPPPGLDPRDFWLFGGRYTGKTWAGMRHFYSHMTGPACSHDVPGGHRGIVVAPSLADAIRSCYEAPSGLVSIDPRIRVVTRRGGTVFVFPNGAEAAVIGLPNARAVETLRAAGNRCVGYLEEFAAIPPLDKALVQLRLGVRLGNHPGLMGSSTPKPRPAVRRMINDPRSFVRTGTTRDNTKGDPNYIAELYEIYEGTSVEAQELDGLLLDRVEGALWTPEKLDVRRIIPGSLSPQLAGETREEWLIRVLALNRVVVSIDPATSGKGDETGIVVVGASKGTRRRRQAFILEDRTKLLGVEAWRDLAVETAERWRTSTYVVEKNRLGQTAKLVMEGAAPNARIIEVEATVSKGQRADPVAARWTRQVWLVGSHPKLENQMTSWVPAEGDDVETDFDALEPDSFRGSPDAIDAMVHGVTELLGIAAPGKGGTHDVSSAFESGWNS